MGTSISRVVKIVFLVFIFLPVTIVQAQEADLFVACKYLPLHQSPSGLSDVIAIYDFGTQVRVIEKTGFYESPVSASGGGKESDDDSNKDKETSKTEKLAAWAKVKVEGKEGYLNMRCLVDKKLLDRQDPDQSLRRLKKGAITFQSGKGFSEKESGDLVAMKGFSEKEKGDNVAMKGAGGNVKSGRKNYAAVDAIYEASLEYNPQLTLKNFRKEGKIGEFSK